MAAVAGACAVWRSAEVEMLEHDLDALASRLLRELAVRDWRTPLLSPRFAPAGGNVRIADYIDHTLLKAEATGAQIDRLCEEALEYRFAAVCVNPIWVSRCHERLAGSGVAVASVVGFPLGASCSTIKASEAQKAVADGASELDMVASIGHIKGGNWQAVHEDIAAVVEAVPDVLVKVIIESAALTPEEIVKACVTSRAAGAGYVKTSTGFHPRGGATTEAVALMRLAVGDALGVKASGGIRDCATAIRMIFHGATRIGTSSGAAIARCLGETPLPLADLLRFADRHTGACNSGDSVARDPSRSY